MMRSLPPYCLFMPSPADWLEVAKEVFGQNLQPLTRYSVDTTGLSVQHLEDLLNKSPYKDLLVPLNMELTTQLIQRPEGYLEVSAFDSVQDFIERGLSFAVSDHDQVMGVAYSSLVCSRGIEVSIYVDEPYRQQGIATTLGSKLTLACLQNNLRPNWDAANPESCKLAKKLGYMFVETYEAHYHTGSQ